MKIKLRPRKGSFAFTLLEIMIAIALLAMIVAAIYNCWNFILKGSRVALDAAAAAQRTRITLRTLHDSLVCACVFNANISNYVFEAETDGDNSSLSFVARLPRSFPRSGKFGDLTTRRLEFTVEQGPDSKNQLVLRQRPLITDFDKDEMQFPLVLAKNVKKFLVEFTDPQNGDWISDWSNTNQLPQEIKITIGLGALGQYSTKDQEEMVDIVALLNKPVLLQWQMTGPQQQQLGAPGNNGVGGNNGVNNGINGGNGVNGGSLQPNPQLGR